MTRTISVLLLGLTACSVKDGNGVPGTEVRDLEAFEAVTNNSTLPVLIEVGPAQNVTVDCDENLLPHITTEVTAGVLIPSVDPSTTLIPTIACELTITTPYLDRIQNSSTGGVEVIGDLAGLSYIRNSGWGDMFVDGIDAASVRIFSQSKGRLVLSGLADVAALDSSGAGGIEAGELVCIDVNINSSGAGDVVVTVTDTANVHVEGDGDVVLHGDPETVTTDDDGCGDVY
jgi:hypothetical protein